MNMKRELYVDDYGNFSVNFERYVLYIYPYIQVYESQHNSSKRRIVGSVLPEFIKAQLISSQSKNTDEYINKVLNTFKEPTEPDVRITGNSLYLNFIETYVRFQYMQVLNVTDKGLFRITMSDSSELRFVAENELKEQIIQKFNGINENLINDIL